MAKLICSVATFNEIAGLLEAQGIKPNERGTLSLEKGAHLVPPIDYRLATIRKDCIAITGTVYKTNNVLDFLRFAAMLYDYVLNGNIPIPELPEASDNPVRNPIVKPAPEGWEK